VCVCVCVFQNCEVGGFVIIMKGDLAKFDYSLEGEVEKLRNYATCW